MIEGTVSSRREAIIPLTVFAADGLPETFEAVVDTGFTDFVTLPARVIDRLSLTPAAPLEGMLADGSIIEVMLFRASVLWDGVQRAVFVVAAEGKILVGMSLLYGYDFLMQTMDGGAVRISQSIT